MTKFPTIVRKPIAEQRFTTIGDWWEEESGKFVVTTSEMADWRHEFLVLVHELTEWGICQVNRVPTRACDEFDELWETELEAGLQRIEVEAGFDRRCPYRSGHVWGTRMERWFALLLRVNWKEYCAACDELIKQRSEQCGSV